MTLKTLLFEVCKECFDLGMRYELGQYSEEYCAAEMSRMTDEVIRSLVVAKRKHSLTDVDQLDITIDLGRIFREE